MEATNVHSLDAHRTATTNEAPPMEFDPVNVDDLDDTPAEPVDAPPVDDVPEVPADGDDTPGSDDTDPEDRGPCTVCDGNGSHRIDGDEVEACVPCGGTGREGAQATLPLPGAGDVHVDTGQVRAFDVDALTVKDGSRLGGRRATTGEVSITGGKAKALRLDERNRIPKGATVRLEVVGKARKCGERDDEKDGFHAGTVLEVNVKASHVAVVSWMHDEDGLRWDEEHGLRERIRPGVWMAVATTPVVDEDTAGPEADGGPLTGPGFGTGTDEKPEGVPATDNPPGPADDDQGGVPTTSDDMDPIEAPPTDASVEVDADGSIAAVAPAPVAAASVILGRPETYTPAALDGLKKDELREVLEDLNVSGVPARIDRATLLAMANSAAGNNG